jgi:hypothetical protein
MQAALEHDGTLEPASSDPERRPEPRSPACSAGESTDKFATPLLAIDAFGVLPFFVALTEGMELAAHRWLTAEATLTALGISLAFRVVGPAVFRFLGTSQHDFQAGRGLVLLAVAVHELLRTSQTERSPDGDVGVVPIGVSLIMGPAGADDRSHSGRDLRILLGRDLARSEPDGGLARLQDRRAGRSRPRARRGAGPLPR